MRTEKQKLRCDECIHKDVCQYQVTLASITAKVNNAFESVPENERAHFAYPSIACIHFYQISHLTGIR